ncbi:uncharacterized protein V3H82_021918 [Fundulus diaphanus]
MNESGHRRTLPDQSSGSGHTFDTSHHQSVTSTILSKRVCFYKSGDPQFNGLRVVINNRTFKTFDALLDSLSKKVPLPFGVRNITTPRGVHGIHTLDELEDGKSYICSDSRKVKPIDLALAQRRLPPWYHARPVSSRRRTARFFPGRKNIRREDPVVVRTPKKLVVFRNGDPSVRYTVLLHKKTTPSYESILGHISELMQFQVNKLHSPDGRRIDGLPGLILSSGSVVAVGREPFRPAVYNVEKSASPTRRHTKRRAFKRNFSASSERYLVHQIHNSIAESSCDLPTNSTELDSDRILESLTETEEDTCLGKGHDEGQDGALSNDDNIEKSFRVNQDGSMTVEMKVRLTIKEEETVQWTTTLTRSVTADQLNTPCLSDSGPEQELCSKSSQTSAASTDIVPKDRTRDDKDDDPPSLGNKAFSDSFQEEVDPKDHTEWVAPRRAPTPGCKKMSKLQASLDSITSVTVDEFGEGNVGSYCFREETNRTTTERIHMENQTSTRPVPKPRRLGSVDVNSRDMSAFKSTEIMHAESSGEEVTETVLHIYEQQTCHDNFLANRVEVSRAPSIKRAPLVSNRSLERKMSLRKATMDKYASDNDDSEELSAPINTEAAGDRVISVMPEPINAVNQPNMKPFLEKICYSIKSIRQITQNKRPSCLEKSNSLPDFSSHVASTFGSSSKVLLAFLAVMTLKEGLANLNMKELNANSVSCAEALKMIDSLREIANIEDSQRLRISLSDLQQSASTQLLQSWRGFQELGDRCKSRTATPNVSQTGLETEGRDLEALMEEPEEDKVSSEDEAQYGDELKLQSSLERKKDDSSLMITENSGKALRSNVDDDSGNEHSSFEEHVDKVQLKDEMSSLIEEELSYFEKDSSSEEEQASKERKINKSNAQKLETPPRAQLEESTHEAIIESPKRQPNEVITQSVAERVTLLEKQVAEAQKPKLAPKSSTIRRLPQRKSSPEVEDSPSESPTSELPLCTRSAPQSSLSFSYDSSSVITTEPEGSRVRSIREMFLARSATDIQQAGSVNPNSSQLRAETSGSGGYQSQTSGDLSGNEDDPVRKSISKGFVRRAIEMLYGKKDLEPEEASERSPPEPEQRKREASSIFSPFHSARSKAMSELSYFNSSNALDIFSEATRCIAFNAQVGPGDSVPIDDGRWLVRENTSMRKSVSDPVGINKTFTNTFHDDGLCTDTEETTPYSLFSTKPELEDETQSQPGKCTYFSLPHASESEVCPDETSAASKDADGAEETEDASADRQTWAERNGTLPGIAVADFKMKGNKVHPLVEPPPGGEVVLVQPGKGQVVANRRVQEPDVLDLLYNFCGEHCPIL